MKRAVICATFLLGCFLLQVTVAYAQRPSSALIPYDSFQAEFLDPSKWGLTFNWCGSRVLECLRGIQDSRLRLEVRSFGATDSNNSNAYGDSELHFSNPGPIRTIVAELTVHRAAVSACPANADTQAAQTLLQGTFFNSGSGDPNDDMQAFLDIEHYAGEPADQLDALGFLHWQGQFFGGMSLGQLRVGQHVKAKLNWDQPNSRFLVSWTDLDTGSVTQAPMPYAVPNITPPAVPDKLIAVRAFAPNCVGSSVLSAFVDTRFDGVWIGMQ